MSQTERPRVSVLVIAPAVPVQVTGTNTVLRRLLENFDPTEVALLGRSPEGRPVLDERELPYPVIRVVAPPRGVRGERFWRVLCVGPGTLQGWAAVRRHRPAAILATFPDEWSLWSGLLLHRLTGVPLLAYFCDLYAESRQETWERSLAAWLQRRVFAAAHRVFAVNQGMVDFYRERHGLQAVCLPACINQSIPGFVAPPQPRRPFRIGYSGNVNDARIDSLRALVQAVGRDPGYELRYFTPQSPALLKELGLWATNASAEFVTDEAALVPRLAECDALFLPLTFACDTLSRDFLATCFGIKSYEYFLAQRPIVVHSPRDYFLARFYRTWECGVVVDDPSPAALLSALRRVGEDRSLRESVVRQGLAAAREFEGARVADILRRELRALR